MMRLNFTPRKSQEQILNYTGGTLGISAVPGSGKTQILSALAAKLLVEGNVKPGQEILIVTLVNSAVENFASRIERFVKLNGLFPNVGYRVRTLHGLAFDILREDPSLVGLDSSFSVIDEKDAAALRAQIIKRWMNAHPDEVGMLLKDDLSTYNRGQVMNKDLPLALESFALAFIRTAKDANVSPSQLIAKVDKDAPILLAAGTEMYDQYQKNLTMRGMLDFDDLISLALASLRHSPELADRLRAKFAYILEDEAQDSSLTQERILRAITNGNWVRVGDPNQAIYETFTTASPEFLIDFIRAADLQVDLPETGRCQPSVMRLANDLIRWTNDHHPIARCRDALRQPYMIETAPNDPQQNPADRPDKVVLFDEAINPDREIEIAASAAKKYVKNNPEKTIAILATTNKKGIRVIEKLRELDVPFVENLNSSNETRVIIQQINIALAFLDEPTSAPKTRKALELLVERTLPEEDKAFAQSALASIKKIKVAEEVFTLDQVFEDPFEVKEFAPKMTRLIDRIRIWLKGVLLPVDQIILLIGQDLFREPTELALVHKLAFHVRQGKTISRTWGLGETISELSVISTNQKKFVGFSASEANFDPDAHRGKVLVSTIHKAKGLEWDKVIILSVNNFDFPGYQEGDQYLSEKWFLHGGLNMEAEGVSQLRATMGYGEVDGYEGLRATDRARIELVKERLRVLYVAITRAREELALTWNTGKKNATPAIAFSALEEMKDKWERI